MCNNSFEIKSGSDNAIFCVLAIVLWIVMLYFFCELYFLI